MLSKKRGVFAASAVAVALAASLVGCAGNASGGDDKADKTVKIGVVGASDPYWKTFEKAASDAGIKVEIKDFTDYNLLNPAVSEGELDLNQFQHLAYLADYNVANSDDLVAIGSTAIYPLGLFSTKHKKLDEIPKGGTVAVPSDPSNRARALNVLAEAGLLKLKNPGSLFSSQKDIDAGASKVTVTEMDAAFTATSLQDVDGAVVNNDFVTKAGLKFSDALFQDDPKSEAAKPFINVWAAKSKDKDNETYKKLVEIYQNDKAVQDGVFKNSGDSAILLKTPVSELQTILTDAEKQVKANKG